MTITLIPVNKYGSNGREPTEEGKKQCKIGLDDWSCVGSSGENMCIYCSGYGSDCDNEYVLCTCPENQNVTRRRVVKMTDIERLSAELERVEEEKARMKMTKQEREQVECLTNEEKVAFLLGWQWGIMELGYRMNFKFPKDIEDMFNKVINAAERVLDHHRHTPAAHEKMLQMFIQNILDGKPMMAYVDRDWLRKVDEMDGE